jgi:hypothetical protein
VCKTESSSVILKVRGGNSEVLTKCKRFEQQQQSKTPLRLPRQSALSWPNDVPGRLLVDFYKITSHCDYCWWMWTQNKVQWTKQPVVRMVVVFFHFCQVHQLCVRTVQSDSITISDVSFSTPFNHFIIICLGSNQSATAASIANAYKPNSANFPKRNIVDLIPSQFPM